MRRPVHENDAQGKADYTQPLGLVTQITSMIYDTGFIHLVGKLRVLQRSLPIFCLSRQRIGCYPAIAFPCSGVVCLLCFNLSVNGAFIDSDTIADHASNGKNYFISHSMIDSVGICNRFVCACVHVYTIYMRVHACIRVVQKAKRRQIIGCLSQSAAHGAQ